MKVKIDDVIFDRANYDADGDVLYLARGTSNVAADAATALPSAHVAGVTADASTSYAGATTATIGMTAEALIGGTAPTFVSTGQGVAFATGAPASASTNAVLTHNPAIAAAVGASPSFLAEGELGGAYAIGGTGSETTTSTLDVTVALSAADMTKDLVLGLFSGTSVGGGVTGVTLNILANGASTFSSFTSGSAAAAHFSDNPVDLGPLSGSAYSSGTLNLEVVLKVTADAGSSGFYGGVVVTG